jgi:polar amino acid transport system permease protein
MVRGVPDIVFFLFFVLVLDQGIEWLRHQVAVPGLDRPDPPGREFHRLPRGAHAAIRRAAMGARNLRLRARGLHLRHRLRRLLRQRPLRRDERRARARSWRPPKPTACPRGQTFWRILVPQMWIYALPGLSNIWMILIKATPLLFLLGSRTSSTGRASSAAPNLGLPVSASRLALLVFPRPPGLLPRLHPRLRDRAAPDHTPRHG